MTDPYGEQRKRKEITNTAKRGGEARRQAETSPSEAFDWDDAIARFKAMMANRD